MRGLTHPEVSRWPGMRAFAVPTNNMAGAARVNLVGREPAGRAAPAREHDAPCRETAEAFLALENPATDRPAVPWVRQASELFQGTRLEELPDLFIEWAHDAPIDAVRSSRIGTVTRPHRSSRTGDHRAGGLAIASGARLTALGERAPLRTVDVAPTLLDFFGVRRPPELEGASALGPAADPAGATAR